jgi:hypothetical protein
LRRSQGGSARQQIWSVGLILGTVYLTVHKFPIIDNHLSAAAFPESCSHILQGFEPFTKMSLLVAALFLLNLALVRGVQAQPTSSPCVHVGTTSVIGTTGPDTVEFFGGLLRLSALHGLNFEYIRPSFRAAAFRESPLSLTCPRHDPRW